MRQVAHVGDVETEAVVLELVGVVASLLLRRARAARYDRGLAPHGLAVRYSELSQPCWEKKVRIADKESIRESMSAECLETNGLERACRSRVL